MFSFVGNAQNKSDSQNQVSKIHIEFGRKSKDCGGFGICKFTIDITFDELLDIIKAFRTSDNGINLNFTKEFYEKNSRILQSGFLVLEEDFIIDQTTSSELGFRERKTLKAGNYKVKFDANSNSYNCYIN